MNKYLDLAISEARKSFSLGNYPVGAVLVIDDNIVGVSGNEIKNKKSYTQHAENKLIIENGSLLHDAFIAKKKIEIYTTLEPCIQCLGACVTNHVNKIVFIHKDLNAGATQLKHDNIGEWYKDTWPEIEHNHISDEPLKLMVDFFNNEIKLGNIKWPRKMLKLLCK